MPLFRNQNPISKALPWMRSHLLALITGGAALLLIAIGIVGAATGTAGRNYLLFLAQIGGLLFLVVYVVATNRIVRANEATLNEMRASTDAAGRAADAAVRSAAVSEAMLAEAIATRVAQEKQVAPRVVVYPDLDGMMTYLTVENLGRGFATNVQLSFAPAFQPQDFLAGMMPEFFAGTVFTLKPGEKKRQPLAQHYHPPFNMNGSIQQMVTVHYSGGIVSGEVTETIPLDFRSFDKILVTHDPIEVAFDKADNLINAVNEMGEAVKSVGKQLDASLQVSANVVNQTAVMSEEACITQFRRLVEALVDEWNIWQGSSPVQAYMMRPMERRMRALIEAALIALTYSSIPADKAQRVRSLFFDIQAAQAYPYLDREYDEQGVVTRGLEELIAITRGLNDPADESRNEQI